MPLGVKIDRNAHSSLVVILSGAIDSQTASQLKDAVNPLLTEGFSYLIFDFAKISYITSSGLSVIVEVERSLRFIGKKLFLINTPEQIKKVISVVSALPGLKIFKNNEEVDKYIAYLEKARDDENSL
jgi:anti-anti-sigma factor